jgi:hypothetical protein
MLAYEPRRRHVQATDASTQDSSFESKQTSDAYQQTGGYVARDPPRQFTLTSIIEALDCQRCAAPPSSTLADDDDGMDPASGLVIGEQSL